MGNIEKIMQNLCDAMYPLPSTCDKTYGFFHFLGHIKEKRKILISPEMHKKGKSHLRYDFMCFEVNTR